MKLCRYDSGDLLGKIEIWYCEIISKFLPRDRKSKKQISKSQKSAKIFHHHRIVISLRIILKIRWNCTTLHYYFVQENCKVSHFKVPASQRYDPSKLPSGSEVGIRNPDPQNSTFFLWIFCSRNTTSYFWYPSHCRFRTSCRVTIENNISK